MMRISISDWWIDTINLKEFLIQYNQPGQPDTTMTDEMKKDDGVDNSAFDEEKVGIDGDAYDDGDQGQTNDAAFKLNR